MVNLTYLLRSNIFRFRLQTLVSLDSGLRLLHVQQFIILFLKV